MNKTRITLVALIAVLCAIDVNLRAADNGADLDSQLAALRQDLADTRLQLQQAKNELSDIRQFLAEKNVADQLDQWRTERAKLAEERRLLQMERTRLEATRKALHQTTAQQAQQAADEQQKQQQQQIAANSPIWGAQYEIGLIEKDQPTIYINRVNGRYLIDQYPTVDRHNVIVRGSFMNRSQSPWRYTFEIRLASSEPIGLGGRRILASWPYQTPLLTPGELHSFEVKLNLRNNDISAIDIVQIGNVTADRPADPNAPTVPAVPATPATQATN